MTILNLMGVSDDNRSVLAINARSIDKSAIIHKGNVSVFEHPFFKKFAVQTILLGGEKKSVPFQIARPSLIFNSICDPDTNANTLDHASQIVEEIGAPVINHPAYVKRTRRDAISRLLGDKEHIRVPKTVRIIPKKAAEIPKFAEQLGFSFPYILRPAGTHGGRGMLLLSDPSKLPELEQFAFDGREYYMTEFVDFRSPDGLYRKYRFFVIGGEAIPRHMIASESWKIHSASRESELYRSRDIMKEEKAFVDHPPQQSVSLCTTIYETLKLDFFGIDCSIDEEGNLLVFEINACMRYATPDPKTDPFYQTEKIEKALARLIEQKAGGMQKPR
ncbi:ATP-grasp domain-containing protein [Hydrogenimonas sp.]